MNIHMFGKYPNSQSKGRFYNDTLLHKGGAEGGLISSRQLHEITLEKTMINKYGCCRWLDIEK